MREQISLWQEKIEGKSTEEVLEYFLNTINVKIGFASSLGVEDQILTDMICKVNPDTNIFTLDTGRLPKETYALFEKTRNRYKKNIEIFFPQATLLEPVVNKKGLYSFYESIENRKECCFIRKIEPLQRALKGLDVWITGLRSAQSVTREDIGLIQWDENNGLIKLNPLIAWSEDEVWEYAKKHHVPINELHPKGYPSIGCEPCTRAIAKGDDVRSGRWWWENPQSKECGLHARKV